MKDTGINITLDGTKSFGFHSEEIKMNISLMSFEMEWK